MSSGNVVTKAYNRTPNSPRILVSNTPPVRSFYEPEKFFFTDSPTLRNRSTVIHKFVKSSTANGVVNGEAAHQSVADEVYPLTEPSLSDLVQADPPPKLRRKRRAAVKHRLSVLRPVFGISLALLQCAAMAFVYLMVSFVRKKGGKNNDNNQYNDEPSVSPLLISNMRMFLQLLVTAPLAVFHGDPLIPPRRYALAVFIRCMAGSLGVVSLMFAMSYAPISDASSIVYTSPIFVAILARLFLGERLSFLDSALLSVTVVGVIFITRPAFIFKHLLPRDEPAEFLDQKYPNHYLGLAFAVASAFTSSAAIVAIRKVRSLPFSLILVDFSLVGIVVTTALCLGMQAYSLPPCDSWDRHLLIGSALLGTLGQFFLYGALRFENAGIISATASMGIVFTFILQIVFRGENPPWTSVLGASLVTFSITCLGLRKWLASRRDAKRGSLKSKKDTAAIDITSPVAIKTQPVLSLPSQPLALPVLAKSDTSLFSQTGSIKPSKKVSDTSFKAGSFASWIEGLERISLGCRDSSRSSSKYSHYNVFENKGVASSVEGVLDLEEKNKKNQSEQENREISHGEESEIEENCYDSEESVAYGTVSPAPD
ncbi:unnamed protein product [Gordionus sp. m RMFG-2023]|uniref:uncharacterized protein LOC135922806 n=1 Tax=Gordionus sp. m RMFG-2023 TaxID=3053472 RepID=UPI0030E0A624